MGLREAVVEIVEQMEGEYQDELQLDLCPNHQRTVRGWIKQFHSALKASEGEQLQIGTTLAHFPSNAEVLQHEIQRRAKEQTKRETFHFEQETNFKLCTGGKSDGVMIPTYPDTPVTARTWIEGEVYEFDGKEWKFNESVTEKMVKEIHSKQ